MTVTITLTTAGEDTGPFNLFSDVTSYLSAFNSGVSRSTLLAGFTTSNVPDGTTTIRVISTGVCTNYIDIPVEPQIQCGQFIFQAGEAKDNIVTYKDCLSSSLETITLSPGNAVSICAYKDVLSYPVFTEGYGNITLTGDCTAPSQGCVTYMLYAIVGEGGATFNYIPCGESSSTLEVVADGQVLNVCANSSFVPQLIDGTGSVTNTTNSCSTTTTTSTSSTSTTTTTTSSTSTTTSTTTTPP